MKFFIVVAVCVALSAASVIPPVPRDNSHYVEGESRYVWIPSGEGELRLVDLQQPVDELMLTAARNGANNAYWLFTRQNPTNRQILVNGNLNSVRNSNYRANRGTVVVVHGWNSNGNSNINPMIRDAFLAVQDVNVIVLCWGGLANSAYTTAMNGVPSVGQHLGNFLNWVFTNIGGNWNQLHLVGFSLGAHVVGNAGRQVGGRPSRVTGLDPAGPFWHNHNQRLQPNAGRYVEAIHTDGGILGIMDRVANADFYPNGGRNPQPGCGSGATASGCSHGRAFEFFASSVRNNRFVGRQCSNIQQAQNNQCTGSSLNMGNGIINKNGNGIFGLRTAAQWPF